jgi:hypothetical protein
MRPAVGLQQAPEQPVSLVSCRKQKAKPQEDRNYLRRVLVAWVNHHPEEHVTNSQLFNIMREATGEFIEQHRGSAGGGF